MIEVELSSGTATMAVNSMTRRYEADGWHVRDDGVLVVYKGENSAVATFAAGQWQNVHRLANGSSSKVVSASYGPCMENGL